MCGQFYIRDEHEELSALLEALDGARPAAGDIKPSCSAPVIISGERGLRSVEYRFGIRRTQGSGLIINARSETAAQKPMFARSLELRRCVVAASGFYEWDGAKNKYRCFQSDLRCIFMAAIYENGCFVILTVPANASLSAVHSRMPVLLERSELTEWTEGNNSERFLIRQQPMLCCERVSGQLSFL